ncbi:MAG: hypothetical protein QM718_05120 [Steroidobacteraceae bacterium]
MCQAGDVGPVTPYGELPGEVAAKKVVFAYNCLALVDGKVREAFEKYVSRDFCGHGHLLTKGVKSCGSYDESLANFERMAKQFSQGDTLELPTMASVNGEMVTMYGAGVDIFRVVDGKITDHWDASPPAQALIKAHSPEATARMNKVIADAVANGTAAQK